MNDNDEDFYSDIDWDEAVLLLDKLEHAQQAPGLAAPADIEDLMVATEIRRTLYDRFRSKRGFLSVTDLTAPGGWCEQQYAYSLAGRRDLAPEARPERIITEDGNEIKVDRKLAIAHEKVLQKGREVHKVLEKEVHPEQIYIRTESRADQWGLRLLNQMISLATLSKTGKAREIPLFGFVKDVFVIGVLDEIERRPLPSSRASKAPASNKITDYFSSAFPVKPEWGLFLVDSKTRRMPTMPKPQYTIASRFQLMLYKHLFDILANEAFDWTRFFKHIDVSPSEPLSDSFIAQNQVVCESSDLTTAAAAKNLGDLAVALQSCLSHAGPLQESLELVYRWREPVNAFESPKTSGVRRSRKDAATAPAPEVIDLTEEDPVRNVLPSSPAALRSAPSACNSNTAASDTAGKVATSQDSSLAPPVIATTPHTPAKQVSPAAAVSAKGTAATPINLCEISQQADLIQSIAAGTIIGTEAFIYDQKKLFIHLDKAVSFWQGRAPTGVSLAETNKCRSCEFQDGCEWLAIKADEQRQQAKARRIARDTSAPPRSVSVA